MTLGIRHKLPPDFIADRYIKSLNPVLYLPLHRKDAGKHIDTCLGLDGTDDYISVAAPTGVNPADALSVEFWMTNDTSEASTRLISFSGVDDKKGWLIRAATNTISFAIHNGTGYVSTETTALTIGQRYHIVCVYDKVTLRIYVNGILSGTPTAETNSIAYTAGAGLFIGVREGLDAAEFFDGSLDEIRVYSRVLSATEATINFSRGRTNNPQPYDKTGLVGWWNMDEGQGTVIKDQSGNGNDGAIIGATWVDNSIARTMLSDDAYTHRETVVGASKRQNDYYFDGTNRIQVEASAKLNTVQFTYILTLQRANIASRVELGGNISDVPKAGFELWGNGGNLGCGFYDLSGTIRSFGGVPMNDTEKHFVACVYDGNVGMVIVDDAVTREVVGYTMATNPTTPFIIGDHPVSGYFGVWSFAGNISNALTLDRALSLSDIYKIRSMLRG